MLNLDAQLAAIHECTHGLATAADGNLAAPVEHCPGWSVRDLVLHVIDVQASWGQVVERRLTDRDQFVQPPPPEGDLLIALRDGGDRLVEIIRSADPVAHVWTWSHQQDVAFVSRHQVQEAAVHRWDAEHALGNEFAIDALVAADAVEEFLTFSVPTALSHPDEPGPAMPAPLVLDARDAGMSWTVSPGDPAGTVTVTSVAAPGTARVSARASDLLLWLYGRVDLPVEGPDAGTVATALRELASTD